MIVTGEKYKIKREREKKKKKHIQKGAGDIIKNVTRVIDLLSFFGCKSSSRCTPAFQARDKKSPDLPQWEAKNKGCVDILSIVKPHVSAYIL